MPKQPPRYSQPSAPRHTKQKHKAHDEKRGTSSERGYTSRWRRIRKQVLAEDPLCCHCEARGRVTLATEVDHITPLSDGGTHERDNLQPLCKSCHSKKTAQDKRNHSQGYLTGYDLDGYPIDPRHPANM